MTGEETTLGPRFSEALAWAVELHAGHVRKGTGIPYVSHLLAVASLVLDDGGSEDEASAALLHDAIEDQGATSEEIEERFGPKVASIVAGCTDAWETPKPPWEERKRRYLEHLATADPSVVRVSLADKLHNARAILLDYRRHGDALWQRFSRDGDAQLWYYRSLLGAYRTGTESPLVDELGRTITQLERLVEAGGST